ncbi:TRAP transporter substrate-binding protein [Tropicimonas sp. TH_r6]|uniref:TRAP transporter substrate-binding protein n=1 Tax=Tropicimonas sp. TH_r6 TaxID=3082085 RepID=UPI0029544F55|nr:TRAP transporter substrate-binding protein [Tropicimonas sp. TH_r6]MDV7143890.1 TRAP transporter substrate-binding protein [Tropicimonas sp. TH_r6]
MTDGLRIGLGGYQGPASVHTRGLHMVRQALSRLSDGHIVVEIRENMAEHGHGTADLPGLVEDGALDGCYISSSYLADRVPALSLFDMPFAAPDRAQALAALDGKLGACLAREIEARTGLTLLGVWDNGLRHVSTADRPLRSPAETGGLVLRTLPNAEHQRVFRALGFEPRAVDAKELAGAVARGEVDAHENPLTNTLQFGLHETLPTVTLTGHLMGIALVLINRKRFQSWPEEIQGQVRAAVAEASDAQRALAAREEAASARALLAAGAQLIELTEAEQAAWRRAAEPHLAESRARLAPDLLALFEASQTADRRASA